MIPLSVPIFNGNEWKYVKRCLDSGWVSTAGEYVTHFEASLARYIGRRYAVACMNGTSALHIALLVAGLKPEEEVIVPALTFVAPANAVKYAGGYPVFIDVDPHYGQMDMDKLETFLVKECVRCSRQLINRHTRRRVRAILPVHLLGHPVDMDRLRVLARRFDLPVIEDVAESLGAQYKERKVGHHGLVSCFSFNGNKVITAGGGGMILTDDERLARQARYLTTQAKDDPLEYIHRTIGYNYRLSNLHAAVGLAQMEQLEKHLQRKRAIAAAYTRLLLGIEGLRLPQQAPWAKSIFWLFTIGVHAKQYGASSRQLLAYLYQRGVETRSLWCPLPKLNYFKDCYAYQVIEALRWHVEGLSLPSSVSLTYPQQVKIAELISKGRKKWLRPSNRQN